MARASAEVAAAVRARTQSHVTAEFCAHAMAVLDSSSTSLARVSSHGRGGLSYFAYALLFVLYAVVGRWMLSTVAPLLLVAPFVTYSLDRDKEGTASSEQLALATVCVFMIEEVVDSLLLIVMAKHGVNALRVKPVFNLRMALFLGFNIALTFGFLQIADRVTREGKEVRGESVGNSTVGL